MCASPLVGNLCQCFYSCNSQRPSARLLTSSCTVCWDSSVHVQTFDSPYFILQHQHSVSHIFDLTLEVPSIKLSLPAGVPEAWRRRECSPEIRPVDANPRPEARARVRSLAVIYRDRCHAKVSALPLKLVDIRSLRSDTGLKRFHSHTKCPVAKLCTDVAEGVFASRTTLSEVKLDFNTRWDYYTNTLKIVAFFVCKSSNVSRWNKIRTAKQRHNKKKLIYDFNANTERNEAVIYWEPLSHICLKTKPRLQSVSAPLRDFTWVLVPYAVVGRVLGVNQVVLAGTFEVSVRGREPGPVLVNGHLHGAVVPPAKVVPGPSEVRHGRPARPDAARAADAVTFALQRHEALHRLDRKRERNTRTRTRETPAPTWRSTRRPLTFLPAWLLCRFMSARASRSLRSLASTKLWLKRIACSTWSLQPPQSKEPLASCDEPFLVGSQEQESSSPWLQARARV